jgi:hypothetical protein
VTTNARLALAVVCLATVVFLLLMVGLTVKHPPQQDPGSGTSNLVTTLPTPTPPAVFYASCQEARDAGHAPLYPGDPGYRRALDADLDGVACDD